VKRAEINLCGLVAVRARWRRDPASILRLFFDLETGKRVGVISRALAANRKVYRCVETAELERIADTVHHGGIVAVVAEPVLETPKPAQILAWVRHREPLLLLDRIGNAHNLGALARTAAFFGVRNIVIPAHPQAAIPNDAAYRISEGGLEALQVWRVSDLAAFARDLAQAGYQVIGAATRGGETLRPGTRPKFSKPGTRGPAPSKPAALILGNEEHGIAEAMTAACTRLVTLPGGGDVESLNVSVAGALLMWELLVHR
jgi:TrmH RNA methyltransferase